MPSRSGGAPNRRAHAFMSDSGTGADARWFQPELIPAVPGLTHGQFAAFIRGPVPDTPVDVTVTNNRTSLLSIRPGPGGTLRVRASACFLSAPPPVLHALRRYVRRPRREDWQTLSRFVRQPGEKGAAALPPCRLRTAGAVFDLEAVKRRVNAEFFPDRPDCPIAWGRSRPRAAGRAGRHVCYGSYSRAQNLIRINPLLDDPRVPGRFAEFIVYHERLHALVDPEERGSRIVHHTPRFRRLEQGFPEWKEMQRLSADLVRILLRPPGRHA